MSIYLRFLKGKHLISCAGVVAFAAIAGLVRTPIRDCQGPDEIVCIRVDEPIGNGVRATGFVILSQSLQTTDPHPRCIRVLSDWITAGREGCAEKVTFKGTSLVDLSERTPVEGEVRTVPSNHPVEGDANLPSRCSFSIQPREGHTWGTVAEPDDVEIFVEWDPS